MNNQFNFIKPKNAPVSDTDIIDDIIRVSKEIGSKKVTLKLYSELGKYNNTTASRRFGTWNKALKAAGLQVSNETDITDERLYENILNLWQHLGKQPARSDLENTISEFSQSPYKRRFKTWTNSLMSFVKYANEEDKELYLESTVNDNNSRKSTRDPSLRLRYKVLVNNHFTCQQCGASPAKNPAVILHLDHIIPWSKGGETTLENLQTLCSQCGFLKFLFFII